jgi:hypothetical protein
MRAGSPAPLRLALGGGVLLGLLALPYTVHAQFSAVRGREYREFFNPVNPVRGEAVLGVALLPADEAPNSQRVEVWLPDRFSGELQLETLTADGRFRGEGVYAGSSAGGRWAPLPLSATSGGPRPGGAATLALAVRGPGSALFVARWSSSSREPATRVRLYVNSRRAEMFVRAGAKVSRCTPLGIPQPLRFDAYCDLDLGDLPEHGQLTLIRRDQFDEESQTFTLHARGLDTRTP